SGSGITKAENHLENARNLFKRTEPPLYAAWRNIKPSLCTAALFRSQKGNHFSANTMCQLFLNIYKACGLTDASSHSGRRTFITRLANKGVGVRVLAALAGHSSIAVTQRYIDVNDAQLANAVELL
uniref:tyrosine-type recombinase/integrase n=1 Tax=Yoonia sp. TaxID=2212373 RepID=UPI004047448C